MNFVSYSQLLTDLAEWERQLPAFDAICGIPRSGLLPAAYLALRRNVPHLNLSDLEYEPQYAFDRVPLRCVNPAVNNPRGNRILIVDDSTGSPGHTIPLLRERLKHVTEFQLSFGAVYNSGGTTSADYTYRHVPKPRIFEWNWFRHSHLSNFLLDIDGVLCEDWHGRDEHDSDPAYLQHIIEVPPLWLPQLPVMGLATSRLERYRPQTVAWLAKHGVRYKYLYMHPAATPEQRRARGDHAKQKAEVYRNHHGATLFVESSEQQAKQIHKLTRRPVLCIDTMQLHK